MRFDAPLPAWWRAIFAMEEPVPDEVIGKIVAAGDGGLRAACAIFDPSLGERPVPSPTTDATVIFARVLREFARPELGPWILGAMRQRGGDDAAVPELAGSLAACGPTVIGPVCEWFAETEPGDPVRPWLADAAAHAGARTDEALAVLVVHLADDPMHGAQLLADYGDPSAIPVLLAELDRTWESEEGDEATIVTLGEAIRALGGGLGPERAARFAASCAEATARATEQRRRFIERGGFGGPVPRPDDGDPCPCDSGKDYAACCAALEAELAERCRLRSTVPRRYR